MSTNIERYLKYASMHVIFVTYLLHISSGDMEVQTSTGPVRGTSRTSGVEAFLGIPYAEPPVKYLRFAKPVPKKPWTEVLEATKLSPPCPQITDDIKFVYLPDLTNMSEDCLYLNIWIKKEDSHDTLKPVVIFLHPGGFIIGSSTIDALDGGNFAERGDVVFVSMNYRLGPFGYLLAYIDEAAGNMGMYDQLTAIKWVKDNALSFGGDPENIILMGSSAGAASVIAHIVSPISKHLFHKAILESGGLTLNYFFDNNTRVFQSSKTTASITGCSNRTVTLQNHPRVVVNCLKRLPVEELLSAERIIATSTPVIFLPITGDEFLPQAAIDYLREGKFRKDIPVLAGFNSNEGTIFLSAGFPQYFGVYGHNQPQTFTKLRAIAFGRSVLLLAGVTEHSKYIKYYLSQIKTAKSQEYIHMIANITGDYSVACNTLFAIDFLSLRGNPVYFYKFGYRSPSAPTAEWMGTSHLDELQYVLGNPHNKTFTEKELELSNHLIDRWSNFAKTGNPNIPGQLTWPQYSYQNPLYLNIDQEEESIQVNPNERCCIWRDHLRSEIDSDLIAFFENLD